ncbi:MFS transporter [Anoxybacillus sp. LAT_35]|uniref:MDR family MFS transporter n=1 Tax=unclassified Anoxybacillus TaxID=2639704 RepID=UPI001EDBAD4C|nr:MULTISPECIES: MFS transporter [unclassified Anoxybacillus]MCG5025636.1 MFS transporter [Anoxybacillus flavithermus]MCG6197045.1 MFS transporter [Anoxybacillus sp. LAT_38]MCG3085348.1 MFS transporter [Anoxybacillus sp. LAT27]MCG6172352.1 MFS transporter [Anoxybacillus sp. LAT_11]MCG6175684.1 MFS transporter [Anoxybacillus sp. LAT_31]
MENIKKLHPISITIIIGTLFARMAMFMTIPFLAIYLTSVKGVSASLAGAIIGISSIVGLFGGFFGGYFSDRYGKEKMMKMSLLMWTFVFIGFATAESVWTFFLLNALNGLCRSFFEPSSRALLSQVTKQEHKLLVFNLRYAAINVGAAIGPLVGLKIGASSSTTAFFVTSFVYFLYFILLVTLFSKYTIEKHGDASEHVTLRNAVNVLGNDRVFLFTVIGMILGVTGYSQFNSTIPQYLSQYKDGVQLFSYLIVFNAITVLVVQYPVSRIGKHYSALTSIMLGIGAVALGLFGFGLFTAVPMLFVSMFVLTVGEVMMFSMIEIFIDQISPQHMKGLYFGSMGFTAIGNAAGPWIGGLMLEHLGYGNHLLIFTFLALCTSIGFPVLLYVGRLMKVTKRHIEYSL